MSSHITSFLKNDQGNTWLECNRHNADRIIRHLLTHHRWFYCYSLEGSYILVISDNVDLTRLRDKIKGVEFQLA